MAHATEEKLAPIGSGFINRTILGATAASLLKGAVWGNAVALSQALASSYTELRASSNAAGKAIDISQFKSTAVKRLTTFWPAIVGHTAFFAAYRGNGEETIGVTGLIKPLVVTSIPTLGYAAYTRAMPPQILRMSLYSCVLLHVYDRVWHPKGLNIENMPLAHSNRRVW